MSRRRGVRGAWVVACLWAAAAVPAHAVPAAGLLWRTLETEWCRVHFHLEAETPARRVAAMCDEGVRVINTMLDSAPLEPIEVVVSDVDDRANGVTSTTPYNYVGILAITPDGKSELAHTEDHLRLVLLHELFHVVHIDTISGFPQLVNRVLGKTWPPNGIQPRFLTEGMATYAESRVTDAGRLRTSLFSAPLRVAAHQNDLWSLDDVANYSRRPPAGLAAYVYGAHFIAWLVARHGEHVLADMAHDMGDDIIPYRIGHTLRNATGLDLGRAWEDFLDDLRRQTQVVVDRAAARGGLTRPRRLTRLGGEISDLAFGPDGALYFSANPPNGVLGIYRIPGLPHATPVVEPVVRTNSLGAVAPLGAGTLVFNQLERVRNDRDFADLFIQRDGGAIWRLTHKGRLRDPRALTDGRVVAERRTGTESAVVLIDPDTRRETVLASFQDGSVVYSPAPSPDGKKVVYAQLDLGGRRDLVEIDIATRVRKPLTHDFADELTPRYSPDGRYVVFSSNRDGIFNIYALERATGRIGRLTDTVGAATSPVVTPDGRGLLYRDVHIGGDDIYATAFAPRFDHATTQVALAPRPVPPPPEKDPLITDAREAKLYNPLPSALPKTWTPVYAPSSGGGAMMGVSLVGEDAVGMFNYNLDALYDTDLESPDLSASLRWNNSIVPVRVSATARSTRTFVRIEDDETPTQTTVALSAGADASLPIRRRLRTHNFTVGYRRTLHLRRETPSFSPDQAAPAWPVSQDIGWASVGWSYSDVQSDRDAPGSAGGQAISVTHRAANQFTLSTLEMYETSVTARAFRPVPGMSRHIVGVYLYGGYALGDRRRRTNYRLGGFAGRDFAADLLAQVRFGSGYLRGYPENHDVGDGYMLGSVEYRFPLLELERGFSALPLHFTRLTGVLFGDLGDAFDGVPVSSRFKASVGAEVQLSLLVGYYGYFLVRAGYARGLMTGGEHQPYFTLGVPY